MRDYEVTVIVQPKLEETPRNELVERITGWLTFGETEEDKPVVNHWGRRRMAYSINKHNDGYYLFCEAKLDTSEISEVERNFQLNENILRYMVIRKES